MPLTEPRIAVDVLGTGYTMSLGVDENTTARDLIRKIHTFTRQHCPERHFEMDLYVNIRPVLHEDIKIKDNW
ncbi:unnamed protein product [Vitrella brassicaformis CCMP3155]|uniref:Uncharacterized protein n=1 Tax=Vitrella brassicaformis (strain CCMP3155) TaxID=1169540 RepID=A0A0G4EJ18_VITBC|nr:unnamed protein product [Vitrella brassicaformis CCMP3155]|eukprot:CEL95989.1 unnamed protein product [Vitrella brassicaformis CCMP3155]